jgi:hypothetical protein
MNKAEESHSCVHANRRADPIHIRHRLFLTAMAIHLSLRASHR